MADNRFIELFAEKELRKLYSKVYSSREKYVATGLVGMHRWKRHTGNIIECVETGTTYMSQKQAARDIGVSPGTLAKHLKGKILSVNGKQYINQGLNLSGILAPETTPIVKG